MRHQQVSFLFFLVKETVYTASKVLAEPIARSCSAPSGPVRSAAAVSLKTYVHRQQCTHLHQRSVLTVVVGVTIWNHKGNIP